MTTPTTQPATIKKAVSIIFFLLLFYILPLLAKPELILNWQVIVLALVCSVLFATQPRLSIAESKDKKATDRNTIWLIVVVSGLGQIVSLVEWAYFPDSIVSVVNLQFINGYEETSPSLNTTNDIVWKITGFVLLVGGTLFRLYAIKVLGKYFTSTVQIKDEHKIVTDGPYKYLRHPSYTGAYIAMLGSAVLLNSIVGIIIFGIGMLIVYSLRINTEERTLSERFKWEYTFYQDRTYKMFPLIW